jgi:hypothetical protein
LAFQATCQSFADQFLIHQRTIGLGRIEKGDTALYRSANYLDSFLFLRRWTKVGAQPMQPKPNVDTSSPLFPNLLFCIVVLLT